MAKQNNKKKKKLNEDTLKYYTNYSEKDIPGGIQKIVEKAGEASKPTFIKAKISVDEVMTSRKNAVVNKPSSK